MIFLAPYRELESCSQGSIGDKVMQTGKSLMHIATVHRNMCYQAYSLRKNDGNIGFELAIPVPGQFTLKRYFDFYQDKPHRAELAFLILKLASVLESKGLIGQFLWHPDSWYVLQTETHMKVLFAGHMYTMPDN